ncbi:aspartyl-phosphate phosphatase Spo0E family protein [Alkalicoccus urumqiensis]|uniref:Aspartyl-phosphate phosphatase Spo0E family protein n=1 Tax=Alkalicoccus urumqiensis TaxID=1548213 RepID=A0A2P6MEM4_ALKUR|nr:aspartyl-phosphate phosphatase Spo0E family protein [Alkalicoccus urumqiensis]PRO64700.1 hypothetical protein C6I21_13420 [Alkalicoccus urumqiensis]
MMRQEMVNWTTQRRIAKVSEMENEQIYPAELEKKRAQMVEIALKRGFTHPDTIRLSREVDGIVQSFQAVTAMPEPAW